MEKITSTSGLKSAIQLLEVEQAINENLLKEQFYLTVDSFKPINLIKRTLVDVTSSPYLVNDILSTAIGLTTGYISKKIFVGTSGNLFRRLIGTIMQLGITNVVTQHPEAIKSFGQQIFQRIFQRKQ